MTGMPATVDDSRDSTFISEENRKRLVILTLGAATGSFGMWFFLWLPINLAYQQATVDDFITLVIWHIFLFAIAAPAVLYSARCANRSGH